MDNHNVGFLADVLGSFEHAVLLAAIRLSDEANGRDRKDAQARLDRDVARGAVHATLDWREKKALLSSKLWSGTPVRAGRARRYYRLPPAGIRELNEARAAADNIARGLKWPRVKARSVTC